MLKNKLFVLTGLAVMGAAMSALNSTGGFGVVARAAEVQASTDPSAVQLTVSAPANSSSLTIGGQSTQVQQKRKVELPAGRVHIQLNGIAAKYVPDSLRVVEVKGPGEFTYRSATYQPANSTPEQALAASVGKEVTVYRQTKEGLKPVTGKLEGVNGATAVISVGSAIEIVSNADVTLTRAPEGFSSTASLVVEADVQTAGTYSFEFFYKTEGLGWRSKQSLLYNEDAGKVESWQSSVSIDNDSGTTFPNATISLLAGRQPGYAAPQAARMYAAPAALADAPGGVPEAAVSNVGDQKVFTVPGTVSLTKGQNRQIPLFDAKDVSVTRTYVVNTRNGGYSSGRGSATQATIRLTVDNCEANHLGKPLPAGQVEVQQKLADGTYRETGGAYISDKAENEIFDMDIATSSDVKFSLKSVAVKRVDANGTEIATPGHAAAPTAVRAPVYGAPVQANEVKEIYEERTVELTVRNHKKDKDVEVLVSILGTLKNPPKTWTSKDANTTETKVTVGKNNKVTITYTTVVRVQ